MEKGKDPPETDRIRIGKAESKTILPEDLLTREEAMKLIEAAEHPRDKAYVAVADEFCHGNLSRQNFSHAGRYCAI